MNHDFRSFTKYATSIIVAGAIIIQSCSSLFFRSDYRNTTELLHETGNLQTKPFLKAHLKNGDVCILKDTWQVDSTQNYVTGNGIRYDFNRQKIYEGSLSLVIDSIAIFETNRKLVDTENSRFAALGILVGADIALSIICITNPKACFGSCPTFYINENENFHYADAEGFSNAIAPSLEKSDIDALNNKPLSGNTFSITMKNEALETHCVNDVRLLAYPRNPNQRVYQSRGDDFYLCENTYQIDRAEGDEGDITQLLKNDDRQERFSSADGHNLSSKEELILNFENVDNSSDLGLIMSFRQTMMTTFLIYEAIAYMGDEVGDIFAKLDKGNSQKKDIGANIYKELGDIDVYIWNDENSCWDFKGGNYETGPIAFNHQILPLGSNHLNKNIKVKLVLNKGLWRLDYLALTNIKEKVSPVELTPDMILNKGVNDPQALTLLTDPLRYLISMPGSIYKFNFTLPEQNKDYELFLYSKGYYLEWVRQNWLLDKDLLTLNMMIENPKKYLEKVAARYKKYETQMEQEFWNSKIDPQKFSDNEK